MDTLAQIAPGAALEDELRRFCATAEAHTAIVPERQLATRFGITHAAVRRVLAGLPQKQSELLLLRHAGLSYRELAEALGMAPGSVGTLLARAEAAFEKAYRAQEGQDAM